jgi:hypothetical protein
VRRHIESNNIILPIEILEILRVIALVTINYKQLVRAFSTRLYMRVKVL